MSSATLDNQISQPQAALRKRGSDSNSDYLERDGGSKTTGLVDMVGGHDEESVDLNKEPLVSIIDSSRNACIESGSKGVIGQEIGHENKAQVFVKVASITKSDEKLELPLSDSIASHGIFFSPRRFKDLCCSIRSRLLNSKDIPPSNGRFIDLYPRVRKPFSDVQSGNTYIRNSIRSNKYTLWTFFPKQLVAQFSKLANFYFLCISILQLIPGLSTTGSYTTIVPLIFFVSISMAKEGYDDLRRHRLDKAENTSTTLVLSSDHFATASKKSLLNPGPERWIPKKWEQLRVGDIVWLKEDEAVPADLVLLQVEGESKSAFVETMALDGETDLKSKSPPPTLTVHHDALAGIPHHQTYLTVEDPNTDLYNFHGTITIETHTIPLTNNEVLYRGSIIRNTSRITAVVVYTGEECKIRMNAMKNPRTKAPAMQVIVNKVVIIIVLLVLSLAVANTVAYYVWKPTEKRSFYLANASVSFFPLFISMIILFNT